jgi:predicted nuclease of predicted toxin-antitoxin system
MGTVEHDLGEVGQMVLQYTGHRGAGPIVTLQNVYDLLRKGGTKYVCRKNPAIRPETVALARAFLIATRPELYQSQIAKSPQGDLRLLVDECVTPRVIPVLHGTFGSVTHANYVGLKGCGDSGAGDKPLWQWALKNNIDAIITLDKKDKKPDLDLTRIAKDHAVQKIRSMVVRGKDIAAPNDLPTVVHINTKNFHYRKLSALFNKHSGALFNHLETRLSPVLTLSERGVEPGETFQDMWLRYQAEEKRSRDGYTVKPRDLAWQLEWFKTLKRKNPHMTKEQREALWTLLGNAARLCLANSDSPVLKKT